MEEFKANYINFNGSIHQKNKRCLFDMIKNIDDIKIELDNYSQKITIEHQDLHQKINEIIKHITPEQKKIINELKTHVNTFRIKHKEQIQEIVNVLSIINNIISLKKIKDKHVEDSFLLYQKLLTFNDTLVDINNKIEYNAFNKIYLRIVEQLSDLSMFSNLLVGNDNTNYDFSIEQENDCDYDDFM